MAISAFGTKLQIGDGTAPPNEVFTDIAEVLDISGPALALDTEDTTSHGSTGGWEEVIGTVLRSGDVTFDVNFIPTEGTHNAATGLIKDMVDKTKRNFKLIFPNAASTTWSFAAIVTGFSPSEPVVGKLSASVTLKLTGVPTLA